MEVEVTGTIKATKETITWVDEGLEIEADYELTLKLDMDHRHFLALKRMSFLGETLLVTVRAAQMEMELREVIQETLDAAVAPAV